MINYPLKSYPLEKLLIKEMKVRILGSGTSTGVPQIGCSCPVCTSPDPKDNRLRASAIVETEDARILIDCGPDFRAQVLHLPFEKIDGVLITHEHYDHVGGLDDLRPFCRFGAVFLFMLKNMWHRHCVCGCPTVLSIIVIPVFLIFLCRKWLPGKPFPFIVRRWFLCG